ncbi:glutamate-1-semialdehyde 2,1-aminomutase [Reichenbachiella agarivorans]|uniref:Glutamate-1-semialdehyde 2,1-aminomutase n=1 Tax=Reichenbachiella agarivorans TaxID=2979464 RepID=A0ABY6CP98_9BACT|nr:glutamate-1-semialdehyde 2,1-aminomutase [Reichenbachiella agarivorans]UXP31283.1 glutamate-1-semialdehyde 2,1-aminomutase [Reichenbachiella agarivorans]
MEKGKSKKIFEQAQLSIPGGVNSPVRAFRAVGGEPVFMESAQGAYMTDIDGNSYIDLINSWGPMILGHGNPLIADAVTDAVKRSLSFGTPTAAEVTMAELICSMVPSMDKVRMVNSGTEATMSAIRVARGYTGRDKIIKFEGCYHGHGDSFLIAAGSGAATMGEPDSPGVTKGTARDTLTVPYNNLEKLQEVVHENKDQVAAIILEPVVGNMGCVPPIDGYLQGLRQICDDHGIVLIFDEVMTGFRLASGGAQELYGVKADMTTLGKIIGGGMPVGAYGGRADIMDMVSPKGPVYQAGTLSGNPVAMAAGLAMLGYLHDNRGLYVQLESVQQIITGGIRTNMKRLGLNYQINAVGSMFSLFFTETPVVDFETAKTSDLTMFGKYFNAMLNRGVYLAPSQYETLFLSTAIGEAEMEKIIAANYEALQEIHS